MRWNSILFVASAALLIGCGGEGQDTPAQNLGNNSANKTSGGGLVPTSRTYAQEVEFMSDHVTVVELTTGDGAAVAVVPEYQGRVMTSTFDASKGYGNGWINFAAVEQGDFVTQINVFGGEDRFWLGPEGGQFSIFFDKDVVPEDENEEFQFEHWQTPPLIDTEKFDIASQTDSEVVFTKSATIKNYTGTEFMLDIERGVKILSNEEIESHLGIDLPLTVQSVAYETRNVLKNAGGTDWVKESGLLSIWILGMYKHSDTMRVIVPFVKGDDLGPKVNDNYFGAVPENRLVTKDGYNIFRADGQYRSKIGVGPGRAKDVLGSYDSGQKLLTIVKFTLPENRTDYVNSSWQKMQENPYGGDVVNSYNDGPNPSGDVLGPFYELETSSPALALASGESWEHMHRTFHFTGTVEELNAISLEVLGVDLGDAVSALD